MAKIGEGGQLAHPTEALYQKKLQESLAHIQRALAEYDSTSSESERIRLLSVMEKEIRSILAGSQEIKRAGIRKQAEIVHSDFEHFKKERSRARQTAFEQDLTTLKEYSLLPLTSH